MGKKGSRCTKGMTEEGRGCGGGPLRLSVQGCHLRGGPSLGYLEDRHSSGKQHPLGPAHHVSECVSVSVCIWRCECMCLHAGVITTWPASCRSRL